MSDESAGLDRENEILGRVFVPISKSCSLWQMIERVVQLDSFGMFDIKWKKSLGSKPDG